MKHNKFIDFMEWLFVWFVFLTIALYILIRIIGY